MIDLEVLSLNVGFEVFKLNLLFDLQVMNNKCINATRKI